MRRTRRIDFPPFHAAQKVIYNRRTRRTVWRCGRRFGKTTAIEVLAADEAIKGRKVGIFSPSYKLLLPSYKRIVNMMGPVVAHSSKVDSLIETSTGGEVEFWTLSDEDAGRSRSYDLAIIDEGSLIPKGLKDIVQKSIEPTLLDRRGWLLMAGTPKGIDPDNFFYEVAHDASDSGWHREHMPTAMNPMLDPVGVANLINEYPPLVYQQEFLAEFVDWAGAAFFSLPSILQDGAGVPYPDRCDAVFATIDSATKTGKDHDGTAVCYWAINRFHGIPLTLLDYDLTQIEGSLLESWLPGVFRRLDELAKECGSRNGSVGAHIEDAASGMILLQQSRRRGWPAHAIDSKLTGVGKEERAISVSGYVYQGKVKLSAYAYDKLVAYKGQTRNHLVSQVTGFRIGLRDGADDALDAFMYGVAIALGDSGGF